MRDHPGFLAILRERVIEFLEREIEALRRAEFSSRPPATSSPREYDNSLRLADDRFILINRPADAPPNSALHLCLGRGRRIEHQAERDQRMDWNPTEESWAAIAEERAPWVAMKLLELSVNEPRMVG